MGAWQWERGQRRPVTEACIKPRGRAQQETKLRSFLCVQGSCRGGSSNLKCCQRGASFPSSHTAIKRPSEAVQEARDSLRYPEERVGLYLGA